MRSPDRQDDTIGGCGGCGVNRFFGGAGGDVGGHCDEEGPMVSVGGCERRCAGVYMISGGREAVV